MCMLTFDYPQTYAVTGSAEEQLAQLRSYIWQLVDVLNQADDGNEAGIGDADTAALRTELEKLRKALRDLEAKSGHGLPSGGTPGQTLTKLSDGDYDTGWRTPAGGSDKNRAGHDRKMDVAQMGVRHRRDVGDVWDGQTGNGNADMGRTVYRIVDGPRGK